MNEIIFLENNLMDFLVKYFIYLEWMEDLFLYFNVINRQK